MPGATLETEQLPLFDNQGAPDLRKLRDRAGLLIMSAQATNTRRAYAFDWKDFSSWCRDAGRHPLPASPDTLKLYLVSQLELHAVSTAERRVAAIVDKHRAHHHEPPYTYAVRELMRAARRSQGRAPHQKAALSPEHLRKICRELAGTKARTALRDRALLTLGFAAGMRRSEIADLDLSDLSFAPKGVAVTIRRSKTDQESHGRTVGVFHGAHATSCPVRALRTWLYIRGRQPGPLFPGGTLSNTGRLSGSSIGLRVKKAIASIGLDPALYGAHSLRAGCVTAAIQAGEPESLIMKRTGHKAVQTVSRYVRPATIWAYDVLRKAL